MIFTGQSIAGESQVVVATDREKGEMKVMLTRAGVLLKSDENIWNQIVVTAAQYYEWA